MAPSTSTPDHAVVELLLPAALLLHVTANASVGVHELASYVPESVYVPLAAPTAET